MIYIKSRSFIVTLLSFFACAASHLLFVSCIGEDLEACGSTYNVSLDIPQLYAGEIDSLYVVFHGGEGQYLSSELVTLSNLDDSLFYCLVPVLSDSSTLVASCFTDLDYDLVDDGLDFFSSRVASVQSSDDVNRFLTSGDYRFYRHVMTAYPVSGFSDRKMTLATLNVDSNYFHKGEMKFIFTEIPAYISNVRLRFDSLGSSLDFYGEYRAEALHYKEFAHDFSSGNIVQHYFLPSVGTKVANNGQDSTSKPTPFSGTRSDTDTPSLDLFVEFFDVEGECHASFRLSTLPEDKRPLIEDADGIEISIDELFLMSREKMVFKFVGLDLAGIKVDADLGEWNDWDGVEDGGVVPM